MNAVEAMRGVNQRRLKVSTRIDSDAGALVTVEDTGIGLDPAVVDRIFDPLFTTKSDGLGLGLSISSSIVDAHGGRLWASPRLPGGAIFQFALPTLSAKY